MKCCSDGNRPSRRCPWLHLYRHQISFLETFLANCASVSTFKREICYTSKNSTKCNSLSQGSCSFYGADSISFFLMSHKYKSTMPDISRSRLASRPAKRRSSTKAQKSLYFKPVRYQISSMEKYFGLIHLFLNLVVILGH